MHKKPRPTTIALAAGLLCVTTGSTFALGNASDQAEIKHMTFDAVGVYGPIRVISTKGNKWDAIAPGTLKFSGDMSIKTKAFGRLRSVAVVLGQCAGSNCAKNSDAFYKALNDAKEWSGQKNMSISTSKFQPSSQGSIAAIPYGDQIVATCNEHLTSSGATQQYTFNRAFQATFLAYSRRSGDLNQVLSSDPGAVQTIQNAQHAVSDNFTVQVICEPYEHELAEDVPDDPDYAVNGVKLFLSTFSNANSNPAPGVQCKKGRVRVRLTTTKEGPVKFRLYTKVGDGPLKKDFVEAWSSPSGSGFKAEYTKWVSVTKSTKLKAMVQDLTKPSGDSSGWKELPLNCSAPGGGGWAQPQTPDSGAQQAEQPAEATNVIVTPRPQANPSIVVTPKPARPAKPKIKVVPKPKLVCINGRISRNSCFCPARTVKKRIGAAAYRCDRVVAKPKRVIPKAPPGRLRPKAQPKRIIIRAPPKRRTPKRVTPKRKAAPKIGTRTRRAR